MLGASGPIVIYMLKEFMSKMRSLGEIFSQDDNSEELYSSDQRRRKSRANLGRFTRFAHTFDFIHLVKNWEKIVGTMLSQNTIPLKIKNNQLFILTKHAVFSQELSFMDQMIIKKIEEMFPAYKGKIKKVRFSTGNFSSDEFNQLQDKKKKQVNISKAQKGGHRFDPNFRNKKAKAEDFFSDIEDDEMRELLIQVYLAE